MSNKQARQLAIVRSLLFLGLLSCSGFVVSAQDPGDEQVRTAQEASDKAAKARPPLRPTSLVLMNGVLVEMPISTGEVSPATEINHLNAPLSNGKGTTPPLKAAARSNERPADPPTAEPLRGEAKKAEWVIGPQSTDRVPGDAGSEAKSPVREIPANEQSTYEPTPEKARPERKGAIKFVGVQSTDEPSITKKPKQ